MIWGFLGDYRAKSTILQQHSAFCNLKRIKTMNFKKINQKKNSKN
jgi:hypothetical protein